MRLEQIRYLVSLTAKPYDHCRREIHMRGKTGNCPAQLVIASPVISQPQPSGVAEGDDSINIGIGGQLFRSKPVGDFPNDCCRTINR